MKHDSNIVLVMKRTLSNTTCSYTFVIEISMILKSCRWMDPIDMRGLPDHRHCIHGMYRKFYPKIRCIVHSLIVEFDDAHLK
jgi:hypothetical protein